MLPASAYGVITHVLLEKVRVTKCFVFVAGVRNGKKKGPTHEKTKVSRVADGAGGGEGRGGEEGRGSNQSIASVFPEFLSTLRFLFTE